MLLPQIEKELRSETVSSSSNAQDAEIEGEIKNIFYIYDNLLNIVLR